MTAELVMKTLAGDLLIAMPQMQDPRFARSVVYMCAHSEAEGAMGLVINKPLVSLSFEELCQHLKLEPARLNQPRPVYFGGPVDPGRGFVLHTADYSEGATLKVGGDFAVTATLDILRAIGAGGGPNRSILALGYAGWAPGQLDAEIQANGWLSSPAGPELIFETPAAARYDTVMGKLGIDPAMLSSTAGRA